MDKSEKVDPGSPATPSKPADVKATPKTSPKQSQKASPKATEVRSDCIAFLFSFLKVFDCFDLLMILHQYAQLHIVIPICLDCTGF